MQVCGPGVSKANQIGKGDRKTTSRSRSLEEANLSSLKFPRSYRRCCKFIQAKYAVAYEHTGRSYTIMKQTETQSAETNTVTLQTKRKRQTHNLKRISRGD